MYVYGLVSKQQIPTKLNRIPRAYRLIYAQVSMFTYRAMFNFLFMPTATVICQAWMGEIWPQFQLFALVMCANQMKLFTESCQMKVSGRLLSFGRTIASGWKVMRVSFAATHNIFDSLSEILSFLITHSAPHQKCSQWQMIDDFNENCRLSMFQKRNSFGFIFYFIWTYITNRLKKIEFPTQNN